MRSLRLGLLGLCVLLASIELARAAPTDAQRIEAVLTAIGSAKVTFLRNGAEHDGKAAAEHLRKKLKHLGTDVKTFDDFVEKLGTRSSTTGKLYEVRREDGKVIPCAEWLRELDRKLAGK